MDALFGETIDMLSAVLDVRSERHKVITSNIANIDTPDYRPKDILFREELEEALDGREKVHSAGSGKSPLSDTIDLDVVEVGEKIDLDTEMAKLAENNLMYNLAVELLARKFKGLDTLLTEAK
ncbi:MAG: flagellar basal body rod protein FlgB [Deltaproteobacteria bacterium]|nr:flagellar basal body rod protein FlgB [Deltaproteobacteria bacterium]